MKGNYYSVAKNSVMKILEDNWVSDDTDCTSEMQMADSQNSDLVRRIVLGVKDAIGQYMPDVNLIFNDEYISFARERTN